MTKPTYYLDPDGEFLRPVVGTVPQIGAFVVIGRRNYRVLCVRHECTEGHPGPSLEERIVVRAEAVLL